MKRRDALGVIAAALASRPSWVFAQSPPKRPPLIGLLASGASAPSARYHSGFPQGMRELGYLEGRDYSIEARYADGDLSRLGQLADDLIRLKVDLILAGPTSAVVAAKRATAAIPIVGINMNDPINMGLIASEARPGGNVTGMLVRVEGLSGKAIEIALDLVPAAKTIGALINITNPSGGPQRREIEVAAAKSGLRLLPAEVRRGDEAGPAVQSLHRQGVNIVVVLGDPMFLAVRRQIAAFALAARLPTVFSFREYVEDGGVISYGIDLRSNYRRGAFFVDRILKGEKPADLPIEFPTKLELVINLTSANAIGLTIPPTMLARADEVIE